MGDMGVYVIEPDSLATTMGLFATSTNPYEHWTRDQILEIHGTDIGQPMPGPIVEFLFVYKAQLPWHRPGLLTPEISVAHAAGATLHRLYACL
jgi:hypothetical protein